MTNAHALCDTKNFYDMMEWDILASGAIKYGFPARTLYPELQMCTGPRLLAQFDATSQPFQATRSIIQGLRSGTRFARCMTSKVMEVATTANPRLSQRLWIDDLSMSAVGSSLAV